MIISGVGKRKIKKETLLRLLIDHQVITVDFQLATGKYMSSTLNSTGSLPIFCCEEEPTLSCVHCPKLIECQIVVVVVKLVFDPDPWPQCMLHRNHHEINVRAWTVMTVTRTCRISKLEGGGAGLILRMNRYGKTSLSRRRSVTCKRLNVKSFPLPVFANATVYSDR